MKESLEGEAAGEGKRGREKRGRRRVEGLSGGEAKRRKEKRNREAGGCNGCRMEKRRGR